MLIWPKTDILFWFYAHFDLDHPILPNPKWLEQLQQQPDPLNVKMRVASFFRGF